MVLLSVSEMTTPSAQSATDEHESVNEKPYRLLVSEAMEYARSAQHSDWDDNDWRNYWNGVIQGICAANGELGARQEADHIITIAKERMKNNYSGRMAELRNKKV